VSHTAMQSQTRSGRNAPRGQPRRDSGDMAFSWPNLLPGNTKPFNTTGSQNAALGRLSCSRASHRRKR
jgi:hypothetical protein